VLVFVGLGLCDGGISYRGLREAREADAVYLELYTSLVPGVDVRSLEGVLGRPLKVVDRKTLEETPGEILEPAKSQKVVLLVPGDPMVATTHVDLRLRAAKMGVATRIVHAGSIISAAAGLTGLQSYKFGPHATVPFRDAPSTRPYEVLVENRRRGLHTLLLLDLRAEEMRAMTANEGMTAMLELEWEFGNGVFTESTLVVVVARAESDDALVKAGEVGVLMNSDFGPPPHVLVVPGKLHFLEAESLRFFAGAPAGVLDELGG
jgi:diphthine synthase